MFSEFPKIEYTNGVLRAVLTEDFSRYYIRLFKYSTYKTVRVAVPRYAPHVSIFLPKFHKTTKDLNFYVDKVVKIEYSPEEMYAGGRRFMGYYLPIYSKDIENIRDEIGVENNHENRLHLCVFNNKAFI